MVPLVARLLKVIISKKILLLILKLYAKSTSNKLDDAGIAIVEGLLGGNLLQVEKGVIDLAENVVPNVVEHFEKKKKNPEEEKE